MSEPETTRSLTDIHRPLEVIAFLLAVLVATQGGLATLVGGAAGFLLALESLSRHMN